MNRTVLAVIVLAIVVAIAAYFYKGAGDSATTGDQTITTPAAPADPAAPAPAPAAPATP